MIRLALLTVALIAVDVPAKAEPKPPLRTVPRVDIARYSGSWYEIARYPNMWQSGCVATVATYGLRSNGDINVTNTCREDRLDGPAKQANGHAWIVDQENQTKLKVRFFWPFSADYWIIDLAPDYSYAVVGQPSRDYLWILSRSAELAPAVLEGIFQRLEEQGYDPAGLEFTPQPPNATPFTIPTATIN